jgi:large conductance mechanosensitive channel
MFKKNVQEFILFIREKGVLGLAIGIIVGGAVTKLVNAVVNDLLNPILGTISPSGQTLEKLSYTLPFSHVVLKWGDLLSNILEFVFILAIVYFVFMKMPYIRDLDKKKE